MAPCGDNNISIYIIKCCVFSGLSASPPDTPWQPKKMTYADAVAITSLAVTPTAAAPSKEEDPWPVLSRVVRGQAAARESGSGLVGQAMASGVQGKCRSGSEGGEVRESGSGVVEQAVVSGVQGKCRSGSEGGEVRESGSGVVGQAVASGVQGKCRSGSEGGEVRESGSGVVRQAVVSEVQGKCRSGSEGGEVRESGSGVVGQAVVSEVQGKCRGGSEGGEVRESGSGVVGQAVVSGVQGKCRIGSEGGEVRESVTVWISRGWGSWAPGEYKKSTKKLTSKISRLSADPSFRYSTDDHVTVPEQRGGGSAYQEAVVFMKRDHCFSVTEVRGVLESINSDLESNQHKISNVPPSKPKTGEVFIVYASSNDYATNDWRCDGYRWVNVGNHKLPKKDLFLRKLYNKIHLEGAPQGSDQFVRHGYTLIDSPNLTLVHYLGDDSCVQQFPHGNRKADDQNFARTCPSVLNQIRNEIQGSSSGNVYKKMVVSNPAGAHQGILNPCNLKQVQNMKSRIDSKQRLGKDDLYNLLELAYHLTGTIWKIDIYPDLACVLGIEDLLLELNNILATNQGTILQYDTTFNLGDFYVSPLVFRHSIFDKSPTIPVAFLIHDRKYSNVHEMFLNVLKTKIPNLSRKISQ